MDITEMLRTGAEYMGIGIGIVFAVLGLFFIVIKALLKVWPSKDEGEGADR